MSDHSKTLVPLEVWTYFSPELTTLNMKADIGLFIESLLYYDTILLNISHPNVLCDLINWFVRQNSFKDLLNLFEDGIVKIYDYSFISTAVDKFGEFILVNIQDQIQSQPNTYARRILYSHEVEKCLPKSRHRAALYNALRNNIIEVKSDQFGPAITNANEDLKDVDKTNVLINSFISHIYKVKKLGTPPKVETNITHVDGGKHRIDYNINFDTLSDIIGKEIGFGQHTPLTAAAICNRFIHSASIEKCDLYLSSPMSTLVGNKLYESNFKVTKSANVIQNLKIETEFPDIRSLVNSNKIDYQHIISIRKEAKKFRTWLQQEGERDRNAIIAYHNEVANNIGMNKGIKYVLQLFGVLGGGALGGLTGTALGGTVGGVLGAGIPYLVDIVTKMNEGWKPVVFGEWLDKFIKMKEEK